MTNPFVDLTPEELDQEIARRSAAIRDTARYTTGGIVGAYTAPIMERIAQREALSPQAMRVIRGTPEEGSLWNAGPDVLSHFLWRLFHPGGRVEEVGSPGEGAPTIDVTDPGVDLDAYRREIGELSRSEEGQRAARRLIGASKASLLGGLTHAGVELAYEEGKLTRPETATEKAIDFAAPILSGAIIFGIPGAVRGIGAGLIEATLGKAFLQSLARSGVGRAAGTDVTLGLGRLMARGGGNALNLGDDVTGLASRWSGLFKGPGGIATAEERLRSLGGIGLDIGFGGALGALEGAEAALLRGEEFPEAFKTVAGMAGIGVGAGGVLGVVGRHLFGYYSPLRRAKMYTHASEAVAPAPGPGAAAADVAAARTVIQPLEVGAVVNGRKYHGRKGNREIWRWASGNEQGKKPGTIVGQADTPTQAELFQAGVGEADAFVQALQRMSGAREVAEIAQAGDAVPGARGTVTAQDVIYQKGRIQAAQYLAGHHPGTRIAVPSRLLARDQHQAELEIKWLLDAAMDPTRSEADRIAAYGRAEATKFLFGLEDVTPSGMLPIGEEVESWILARDVLRGLPEATRTAELGALEAQGRSPLFIARVKEHIARNLDMRKEIEGNTVLEELGQAIGKKPRGIGKGSKVMDRDGNVWELGEDPYLGVSRSVSLTDEGVTASLRVEDVMPIPRPGRPVFMKDGRVVKVVRVNPGEGSFTGELVGPVKGQTAVFRFADVLEMGTKAGKFQSEQANTAIRRQLLAAVDETDVTPVTPQRAVTAEGEEVTLVAQGPNAERVVTRSGKTKTVPKGTARKSTKTRPQAQAASEVEDAVAMLKEISAMATVPPRQPRGAAPAPEAPAAPTRAPEPTVRRQPLPPEARSGGERARQYRAEDLQQLSKPEDLDLFLLMAENGDIHFARAYTRADAEDYARTLGRTVLGDAAEPDIPAYDSFGYTVDTAPIVGEASREITAGVPLSGTPSTRGAPVVPAREIVDFAPRTIPETYNPVTGGQNRITYFVTENADLFEERWLAGDQATKAFQTHVVPPVIPEQGMTLYAVETPAVLIPRSAYSNEAARVLNAMAGKKPAPSHWSPLELSPEALNASRVYRVPFELWNTAHQGDLRLGSMPLEAQTQYLRRLVVLDESIDSEYITAAANLRASDDMLAAAMLTDNGAAFTEAALAKNDAVKKLVNTALEPTMAADDEVVTQTVEAVVQAHPGLNAVAQAAASGDQAAIRQRAREEMQTLSRTFLLTDKVPQNAPIRQEPFEQLVFLHDDPSIRALVQRHTEAVRDLPMEAMTSPGGRTAVVYTLKIVQNGKRVPLGRSVFRSPDEVIRVLEEQHFSLTPFKQGLATYHLGKMGRKGNVSATIKRLQGDPRIPEEVRGRIAAGDEVRAMARPSLARPGKVDVTLEWQQTVRPPGATGGATTAVDESMARLRSKQLEAEGLGKRGRSAALADIASHFGTAEGQAGASVKGQGGKRIGGSVTDLIEELEAGGGKYLVELSSVVDDVGLSGQTVVLRQPKALASFDTMDDATEYLRSFGFLVDQIPPLTSGQLQAFDQLAFNMHNAWQLFDQLPAIAEVANMDAGLRDFWADQVGRLLAGWRRNWSDETPPGPMLSYAREFAKVYTKATGQAPWGPLDRSYIGLPVPRDLAQTEVRGFNPDYEEAIFGIIGTKHGSHYGNNPVVRKKGATLVRPGESTDLQVATAADVIRAGEQALTRTPHARGGSVAERSASGVPEPTMHSVESRSVIPDDLQELYADVLIEPVTDPTTALSVPIDAERVTTLRQALIPKYANGMNIPSAALNPSMGIRVTKLPMARIKDTGQVGVLLNADAIIENGLTTAQLQMPNGQIVDVAMDDIVVAGREALGQYVTKTRTVRRAIPLPDEEAERPLLMTTNRMALEDRWIDEVYNKGKAPKDQLLDASGLGQSDRAAMDEWVQHEALRRGYRLRENAGFEEVSFQQIEQVGGPLSLSAMQSDFQKALHVEQATRSEVGVNPLVQLHAGQGFGTVERQLGLLGVTSREPLYQGFLAYTKGLLERNPDLTLKRGLDGWPEQDVVNLFATLRRAMNLQGREAVVQKKLPPPASTVNIAETVPEQMYVPYGPREQPRVDVDYVPQGKGQPSRVVRRQRSGGQEPKPRFEPRLKPSDYDLAQSGGKRASPLGELSLVGERQGYIQRRGALRPEQPSMYDDLMQELFPDPQMRQVWDDFMFDKIRTLLGGQHIPDADFIARAYTGRLSPETVSTIRDWAQSTGVRNDLHIGEVVEELVRRRIWDPRAAHLATHYKSETGALAIPGLSLEDVNYGNFKVSTRSWNPSLMQYNWGVNWKLFEKHPVSRTLHDIVRQAQHESAKYALQGDAFINEMYSLGYSIDDFNAIRQLIIDYPGRDATAAWKVAVANGADPRYETGFARFKDEFEWMKYDAIRVSMQQGHTPIVLTKEVRESPEFHAIFQTVMRNAGMELEDGSQLAEDAILFLPSTFRRELMERLKGKNILQEVMIPPRDAVQTETVINALRDFDTMEDAIKAGVDPDLIKDFDFWKDWGLENFWPMIHEGSVGAFTPDNKVVAWGHSLFEVRQALQELQRLGRITADDGITIRPTSYATIDESTSMILAAMKDRDGQQILRELNKMVEMDADDVRAVVFNLRRPRPTKKDPVTGTLVHTKARTSTFDFLRKNAVDEYRIYRQRLARFQERHTIITAWERMRPGSPADEAMSRSAGLPALGDRTDPKAQVVAQAIDDFIGRATGLTNKMDLVGDNMYAYFAMMSDAVKRGGRRLVGQELDDLPAFTFDDIHPFQTAVEPSKRKAYYHQRYISRAKASDLVAWQAMWRLWGSVSSAFANGTQFWINTAPMLIDEKTSTAKAAQFAAQAWYDGMRIAGNIQRQGFRAWRGKSPVQTLNARQREVLEALEQSGEILALPKQFAGTSSQLHWMRTARLSADPARSAVGKAIDFTQWLGMMPFNTLEQVNRYGTFIAAFNKARAQGLSKEAATNVASKLVRSTQFLYDELAMPARFAQMGPFGRVIFQFKGFMLQQLGFEKDLLRRIAQGDKVAGKQFAGHLAAITAFGGVTGLMAHPFVSPMLSVFNRVTGIGGDDRKAENYQLRLNNSSYEDMVNREHSWQPGFDLLQYGLPGLVGASFGHRIGVSGQEMANALTRTSLIGPQYSMLVEYANFFLNAKGTGYFQQGGGTPHARAAAGMAGGAALGYLAGRFGNTSTGNRLALNLIGALAGGVAATEGDPLSVGNALQTERGRRLFSGTSATALRNAERTIQILQREALLDLDGKPQHLGPKTARHEAGMALLGVPTIRRDEYSAFIKLQLREQQRINPAKSMVRELLAQHLRDGETEQFLELLWDAQERGIAPSEDALQDELSQLTRESQYTLLKQLSARQRERALGFTEEGPK